MAILYSTYSALFGSTSVVFAKLIAEFLLLLGDGIPIFSHWYFYVNLVAWIVLMSYWLARLNNALALYDPLFIIPMLQARSRLTRHPLQRGLSRLLRRLQLLRGCCSRLVAADDVVAVGLLQGL